MAGSERSGRGLAPGSTERESARVGSCQPAPRSPRQQQSRLAVTSIWVSNTRSVIDAAPFGALLPVVRASLAIKNWEFFRKYASSEPLARGNSRAGWHMALMNADRDSRPNLTIDKASKRHYQVVAVSLYDDELEIADRLTRLLRMAGWPAANRSFVIREALLRLDDELRDGAAEDVLNYFVASQTRRLKRSSTEQP